MSLVTLDFRSIQSEIKIPRKNYIWKRKEATPGSLIPKSITMQVRAITVYNGKRDL